MRIATLWAGIVVLCHAGVALADPPARVELRSDTIIDREALFLPDGLWGQTLNGRAFQQEALISHGGWHRVRRSGGRQTG